MEALSMATKGLAGVAAVALAAGLAQADLTGDEVNGEIVGGPGAFQVNPPTATVGDGVEFHIEFLGSPSHAIDIGAASVHVESVFSGGISTGAGEVLVLSDLDSTQGAIVGIENFETNEEYTVDDVSFTDTEIRIEISPNVWDPGGFLSFDIVFEGGDCPPDLDGDGDADVSDFFLFLDLFAAGDPDADFTGDGTIDVSDFFAYLDAFAAGC